MPRRSARVVLTLVALAMTYMLNGKQYLIVAISGGVYTGELVAFMLS